MIDRTQKKCYVASAGVHSLLFLILLFGPGLASRGPAPAPEMQLINFVPVITTDEQKSGGGNPNAHSAPPAAQLPPAPPAPPAPAAAKPPEPTPPPPKPAETAKPPPTPPRTTSKPIINEDSLVPATKPKKNNAIEIPDEIKRDTAADAKAQADKKRKDRERAERLQREKEEAEAERAAAAAYAAQQKKLANIFNNASSRISGNALTVGAKVDDEFLGPGGGGPPYANWLTSVLSIYDRAWIVPDGVTDKEAVAVARITISRDGKVVHARISQPSGSALVDRTVRDALDKVKNVPALPPTARESERTININFSVKSKLGTG